MPSYAGVGSRAAPRDIRDLMIRIGKTFCDMGWIGWSGEAPGPDAWFHQGAKLSARYKEGMFAAIIPWQGFKSEDGVRVYSQPGNNIYLLEAAAVSRKAFTLGIGARGHDHGLKDGGMKLHTRNAIQVMGWQLDSPVKLVVCWAELDKAGRPKGGTATAINLAVHMHIPVINLYTPEGLNRAMAFLEDYELVA